MFSWIIELKSKILNINNWIFEIENHFWNDLQKWQSIAHDWACMTIIDFDEKKYSFFAMEESLKLTNFSSKKPWDFFNIERCVKVWDRIDWHIVSWHIDTTWEVKEIIVNSDNSKEIFVWFDEKFSNYIIPKWSITINWTSLTIVKYSKDFVSVSLIPLTQEVTNLWDLKVWDIVNLEFDLMWKYIAKITQNI